VDFFVFACFYLLEQYIAFLPFLTGEEVYEPGGLSEFYRRKSVYDGVFLRLSVLSVGV